MFQQAKKIACLHNQQAAREFDTFNNVTTPGKTAQGQASETKV